MTEKWVHDMEARMSEVEDKIDHPPELITKKQLIVATLAIITMVFTAGGWAAIIQSNVKTVGETLVEMRSDLKKLGEVATLKIEVDLLKGEVTRLRNERDLQRDRDLRLGR